MAVTEPERLQMHRALTEAIGEEEAGTLMAHLPPVGWADVATKQDIEHLRELTTERFRTVATKQDIAELRAHMDETLRKHAYSLVGFTVGLVSGGAGLIALGAALL
jgi:hypothetical protein